MNDDMMFKIACECTKTQLKMREQFIKDFMEMTNVEDLDKKAIEILKYTLTVAYNKGAADALSIYKGAEDALSISAVSNMGEGEDYDI